ncbi:polyketide cyclase/dehydrase/lipid transport protein [Herbihabitans rhizosphaerae]|uniref:Polyketide cyclase/dehydrase/lipid transport protein n=1 Tax=Herbihabitans rhizosphaerae TaxID=1872711 RepID=A0A4Q7L8L2_9PSEU|nr:SRPBCC family protein [Herbihabitans rhizosphaerae]RZS45001.1 polyketide cyclase/dehydrase/lipid transport protein [Herbihabitans rhizosphaerae]
MAARRFSFELTGTTTADPKTVHSLVAEGPRWTEWGAPLIGHASWAREGVDEPAGVGAIRKVGRWPLLLREETLEHEPGRLHVYTLLSPVVRDYRGEVLLTPRGDGRTLVTWRVAFTERVPLSGLAVSSGTRIVIKHMLGKLIAAAEKSRG